MTKHTPDAIEAEGLTKPIRHHAGASRGIDPAVLEGIRAGRPRPNGLRTGDHRGARILANADHRRLVDRPRVARLLTCSQTPGQVRQDDRVDRGQGYVAGLTKDLTGLQNPCLDRQLLDLPSCRAPAPGLASRTVCVVLTSRMRAGGRPATYFRRHALAADLGPFPVAGRQ